MNMKTKAQHKLKLVVSLIVFLTLLLVPKSAYAQWPPFSFRLTPSYTDGRITYGLRLSNRVDWPMTDVTIKIRLPDGTRFVEAGTQPRTSVSFDGEEITFFNHFVGRPIRDAFFVVEVTDPEASVFTTHAWISWQGDHLGDYLTGEVTVDINEQPLNWERPRSRLQLEARAVVADDGIITYAIYPGNVGGRKWDLTINVPVPEGTTFLSAETPYPFQASFDGQEVSFFAVEVERWSEVDPLSFQVSAKDVTAPFIETHAWATWRNVGRGIAGQGDARSGDIVVQPQTRQWVVSDITGDVPFPNYDLTRITIQEEATAFEITFYTAGDLGPLGEPLQYTFYIDSDCSTDTGQWRNYRGAEYRVQYDHRRGRADVRFWDKDGSAWRGSQPIEVNSPVGGKAITMWLPHDSLGGDRQFCWVAQARNLTRTFYPRPPAEWVPNGNSPGLTHFHLN
jgi:hypothetical protein